jgi:hypothetical protein
LRWNIPFQQGVRDASIWTKELPSIDPNLLPTFATRPEIVNPTVAWGNQRQVMTTMHWAVQESYKYFRDVHGRHGFENNGWGARVVVSTSGPVNAYYLERRDTDTRDFLAFGPGTHTLDIAGHEFAHGVERHAKGFGSSDGEPRAISEAIADIFGYSIERRVLNNGNDWLYGELGNAPGNLPRSLENPNTSQARGRFISRFYQQPNFWDSTEPYNMMGVMTQWFFLLCQGGTIEGRQVNPIGFTKAEQLVYYMTANANLWQNGHDFTNALEASRQAAGFLFGECTEEVNRVVTAWWAVRVGNNNTCVVCPDFTLAASAASQNLPCGNAVNLSFTCQGTPSCSPYFSYKWYVGNTLIGTGDNLSYTPPTASSFTARIEATKATCTTRSSNVSVDYCTLPPTCNFRLSTSASSNPVVANSSVTLNSTCTGPGCSGITYSWSGNGIAGTSASLPITAPGTAGLYIYSVTASKSGCNNQDVANIDLQVQPIILNTVLAIESENATGAGSSIPDAGASGGVAKGYYGNSSEFLTYNFTNVPNNTYYLNLRYASGESPVAGVVINNVQQPNFNLISTASWSGTYGSLDHPNTFSLSGNVSIKIHGTGMGTFSQDKLTLSTDPIQTNCFNVTASASPNTPNANQSIALSASCTGDCSGVNYTWSGPSFSGSGSNTNATAPGNTGNYTYTVTATKAGCGAKQSSAQVTVGGGGGGGTSQCIEAEAAPPAVTGVGGSYNDSFASGGLGLGNYGNSSEFLEYTFNVATAGNYPVTLRYITGEAPTVGFIVNNNGVVHTMALDNCNAWSGNAYKQKTIYLNLQAGPNTIRVQGMSMGTFRQDKLCIGCTANSCREGVAEEYLEKAPESKEMNAYPNPSTGEVTVSFPLGVGQEARISVFNMLGIIVQEHVVAGKAETHTQVLDLNHEQTGTYLIRVMKDEEVLTRKVLLKK